MDQPWLTISLLFAAFWLAMGVVATRDALRERRALRRLGVRGVRTKGEVARGPRREGPTTHPPEVRYKAPPINHLDAPAEQTYRRAPLNADQHPLYRGAPIILRYDPTDPRRVVVVRSNRTLSAGANLTWGVSFLVFGVGLAVWSFA